MVWTNFIYIGFLVFFLTYEPIFGYFQFQKLVKEQNAGLNNKLSYYHKIMISLWIPTFCVIGLILFNQLSLKNIGIQGIQINPLSFNKWIIYSIILLAVLYVGNLIYHVFAINLSFKYKTKYSMEINKIKLPWYMKYMLPNTKEEKCTWTTLSFTTGITEEILYRGFLIYVLGILFPNFSLLLIIITSSLFFGLGHTYQGINGILKTSCIGIFFSALYISLGSIIPSIILHMLMDWAAKDITNDKYFEKEQKAI